MRAYVKVRLGVQKQNMDRNLIDFFFKCLRCKKLTGVALRLVISPPLKAPDSNFRLYGTETCSSSEEKETKTSNDLHPALIWIKVGQASAAVAAGAGWVTYNKHKAFFALS